MRSAGKYKGFHLSKTVAGEGAIESATRGGIAGSQSAVSSLRLTTILLYRRKRLGDDLSDHGQELFRASNALPTHAPNQSLMTKIFITIAICTWNRAQSLRTTLSSLRDMEAAGNIDWEVLVINNNCTDDTEAVISEFSDALPLRQVAEREQGLSSARNCAVAAARGTHILWTDDDAAVDRHWLKTYANAFALWKDAAVFGGPILAKFVGRPPSWLEQALNESGIEGVYALRNFAIIPGTLDIKTDRIPFGANYAIRLKEQRQFRYDPRLGLRKNDNIRGEEVDLIARVLASGAEGRWIPDAIVFHRIAKDRQTTAYIREWFVGYGRTKVRRSPAYLGPSFMGAPRWLWRAAISSEVSFRAKRIFCPPGAWCRELANASSHWGQIVEYRNSTLPPTE
jgi:glucosyl-dolichyl phosphate glucuronosyltransferase